MHGACGQGVDDLDGAIYADAAAPANGSSPKRRRKASPKKQEAASPDALAVASPQVSGAPAPDSDTDAEEAEAAAASSSPKKAKKPAKKAVLKNTGLENKVSDVHAMWCLHCFTESAARQLGGWSVLAGACALYCWRGHGDNSCSGAVLKFTG